jgi:hypothetical protein
MNLKSRSSSVSHSKIIDFSLTDRSGKVPDLRKPTIYLLVGGAPSPAKRLYQKSFLAYFLFAGSYRSYCRLSRSRGKSRPTIFGFLQDKFREPLTCCYRMKSGGFYNILLTHRCSSSIRNHSIFRYGSRRKSRCIDLLEKIFFKFYSFYLGPFSFMSFSSSL